jgi:hypothetical protein
LFINYNVVTFKVHPLCLPSHFRAVLPLFVAFLESILLDIVLRPALQTSGCLRLTQKGVLSLPILLFEIKINNKGARSGKQGGCSFTVMRLDVKTRAQPPIPLLL